MLNLNRMQDAIVKVTARLLEKTIPLLRTDTQHTLQAVEKAAIEAAKIGPAADAAKTTIELHGEVAAEAKGILARVNEGDTVRAEVTTPTGNTYRFRVSLEPQEEENE